MTELTPFTYPITIKELLSSAPALLKHDTARLDTELLLCQAIEKNRSFLFAFDETQPTSEQLKQFNHNFQRALSGEPIAYILGTQAFWDIELDVNKDVLIPRADTEILIETALDKIPKQSQSILDLGTGSGAIALALKSARPDCQIHALDFSASACLTAQNNRKKLELDITITQSSWLDAIADNCIDVIVSNPPYIEENDPHLKALGYEPITALVAKNDGLADYQSICKEASRVLTQQGLVIFEHGYNQAQSVAQILSNAGFINIQTIKDFGNNPRVTLGYKPN